MLLNKKLRHSEWRKVAKKLRRKRIRQKLAEARKKEQAEQCQLSPESQRLQDEQLEEQERFQEEEEARLRDEAHARWLKVEEEAQKQWRDLQKKLSSAREERARQNALIKLEWEREQKRLQAIKEEKERQLEELERQQQLLQEKLENFIEHGGETPEHLKTVIESNPTKAICPFFQKTSACRFRETCSRNHVKPGVSRVLLIPNFYSHYSLEQNETEHGDCSLEFESHETYSHFKEFFYDVLPEMEKMGRVRQFKVCCNREPHLRGNVYVEYSATREAVKSFRVFNGRWYGGKQLSVEFCRIDSWKSAICGLHFKKRCPKGSTCNFLHVFQNPCGLFQNADNDMHRTPPPKSERKRMGSERRDSLERRHWRWSESPERLSLDTLNTRKSSKERSVSVSKKRSKRKRSRSRSRDRKQKSKRKKSCINK